MAVTRFKSRTVDLEFRSAEETQTDGRTLEGYAAVFDSQARIGNSVEGHFVETIKRGAFKKTLAERGSRVTMLWNHGKDPAVGQIPVGVYEELREDEHGLYVRGRLLDTQHADAVRQAIQAGAVRGMSVTFQVTDEMWHDSDGTRLHGDSIWRAMAKPGNLIQRTVTAVRLVEAGPVLTPAYEATSVGVRSNSSSIVIPRTIAEARLKLLDL
ncbi:HK97 family phage prohead protease [Nocardia cyriacigeorgica]|uniref:Phage prohead protease, HK97 family n=1 Tax=Nocardia cyriacigeorgica TaxID=135487 RepID=A0A4U8WFZ1_9NOCA|nr:HK97 family phage prohead protease [Nocardia cyriacigeorgica]VFB01488.1 phage prohead protease, HK97 family [Nocardia cyriacigeorgica]